MGLKVKGIGGKRSERELWRILLLYPIVKVGTQFIGSFILRIFVSQMTGKKTSELLQVLSSAVVHGGEIVIVTPKTIKVPISSLNNHFLITQICFTLSGKPVSLARKL